MKPLENIFSKTKIKSEVKTQNKMPIIVDSREKQAMVITNLVSKNANFSVEKLEVGDYQIGEVTIERKTFPDFVSSMLDKRLGEQLINLKNCQKKFLLIEGFYYDYSKFKIHDNAIRGMLLSVAIDFQIPTVFTQNEEDTANFLILTARKFEKAKIEFASRPSKKLKTTAEQKQFILEGFPEIGPVAAKNLLSNFSNLQEIFNTDDKMLKEKGKLSDKAVEEFRKILKS